MSGRIDVNGWFLKNGHSAEASRRFKKALENAPSARLGVQAANDLLQVYHPKPPDLDKAALFGFPGKVVKELTKGTEAHPAAVLTVLLTCFGNAAGAKARVRIVADTHPARLNTILVGDTGIGRKGYASNLVYEVMSWADPNWYQNHVIGGLQSGEALIEAAGSRSPKVLLIKAAEFSHVLKIAGRQGMTLSEVIREAFDGETLSLLRTSKPSLVVQGVHVSIVAHITPQELRDQLDDVNMANGFANRFLFIHVERPQMVPRPKELNISSLGDELKTVLARARKRTVVHWSRQAGEWWDEMYGQLSTPRDGLVGALGARAEAKLLRLAVAYLLMDPDAKTLMRKHFEAAYAVLRYSDESIRNIFGDRTGSPLGDRILGLIRGAFPCVISQSEMADALGGNVQAERIEKELFKLVNMQQVERWQMPTGGRPRIDIRARPWWRGGHG